MAAALPQHSGRSSVHLDGDAFDGPSPTPSIGVDHTHSGESGRRPGFKFNLFSGTASAAIFASLALCLVIICAYSYLARRRTISATRRRFLGRMSNIGLVSGRPPLPLVATAGDKTPIPAERGADSNSGLARDCPVCLEPLRGGGYVTAPHACGHVFHAPCIKPWLDRRDSCPVCRCTVSCRRESANEAATAAADGGARRLSETMVVVITAETAEWWAAGSADDEIPR